MLLHISIEELEKKLRYDRIKLIDIREKAEYQRDHINGSINIPMNDLVHYHTEFLIGEEKYYLICKSGTRSYATANFLSNLGYNVINVLGGLDAYSKYKK